MTDEQATPDAPHPLNAPLAERRNAPTPSQADANLAAYPRARTPAHPPTVLGNGLAFSLISALLGVLPLMALTYARLLQDRGDLLIQPPPPEGLPLPRAMVWSPGIYNLIVGLARLTPPAVLGSEIFLVCILVYALLRILNPTFRMTTGVDWDQTLLHRTYMHTPPLTKAFLIAIAAFLPAFLIWQALAWALQDSSFSLWLRLVLAGGASWLLFSRDGVAGDYDSGNYDLPRERGVLRSLLLRGALAGTVIWSMIQFAPTLTPDRLFDLFHALGYVGEAQWKVIAAITLGFAALLGFAGGGLAVALGAWQRSPSARVRAGLAPLAVLLLTLLAGRVWLPRRMAERYDYDPNTHANAAMRLAQAAGIAGTPPVPQTAYLLGQQIAFSIRFDGKSVSGLNADPEAARRIEAYLRTHGYRTALSYFAFVTLYDAASLQWSAPESLRIFLLNLTHTADPAYMDHLRQRLEGGTSAATPEVLGYADRLLDERDFVLPDRRAWVLVGDTYAGLGESDKAQTCYRRAQLPETQIPARAAEQTRFAGGKIFGRLLWNGPPAAGWRIGLVPGMAVRQLRGLIQPSGYESPFWLSWVGAVTTTDADGRFALDHVLAGRYRLLFSAPPGRLPHADPLSVQNGPAFLPIGPGTPTADLGDIRLSPAPSATPGERPETSDFLNSIPGPPR